MSIGCLSVARWQQQCSRVKKFSNKWPWPTIWCWRHGDSNEKWWMIKVTINWLPIVAQKQWPWQKLLMHKTATAINSNVERKIDSYCNNQLAVYCSRVMLLLHSMTATVLNSGRFLKNMGTSNWPVLWHRWGNTEKEFGKKRKKLQSTGVCWA